LAKTQCGNILAATSWLSYTAIKSPWRSSNIGLSGFGM